jgi:hypothetical protein
MCGRVFRCVSIVWEDAGGQTSVCCWDNQWEPKIVSKFPSIWKKVGHHFEPLIATIKDEGSRGSPDGRFPEKLPKNPESFQVCFVDEKDDDEREREREK